jgi:gliding motility-associated lipoprotein GldD
LKIYRILLAVSLIPAFWACKESYTPKPRGYFRIELPAAAYITVTADSLPYSLDVPKSATIAFNATNGLTITYPETLSAKIYCSYLNVNTDSFPAAVNEAYRLSAAQMKNSQEPRRENYSNEEAHVFASVLQSKGASAVPLQFILTDGQHRIFRGVLMYDSLHDVDSIMPVTDYLRHDISRIIESFNWKD